MKNSATQNRNLSIDFLQFIGPIFVIFGHSLNGYSLIGQQCMSDTLWYDFSKVWIYIFHMPLFFFISGFLFFYTAGMRGTNYSTFIKKKTIRLLVPYFIWNIAFVVPKYAMAAFLKDQVQVDIGYIVKVFLTPRDNIWGHTWFLVALFILYLFAPIWERLMKSSFKVKIVTTIVLFGIYFVPIETKFLCLNDIRKELIIFWLGIVIANLEKENLFSFSKIKYAIGAFFTIIASACCVKIQVVYNNPLCILITAISIILILYRLPTVFNMNKKIIDRQAKKSFSIYIVHWPIMLCTRILFYQILHLPYIIVVILMIVVGYLGPNVLIMIVNKINNPVTNLLKKYVLGS